MKFFCIGILQQPIGTSQIPCQEFFKFAKLIKKIQNELESQKRNASRSLPVSQCVSFYQCPSYVKRLTVWMYLHIVTQNSLFCAANHNTARDFM
jgi:hypothetical protein